jgi:hypothetical protein
MHGRTCVVRVEVNQWALAVRWRRASERGDKRRCMNEWNKPGPFGNFDGLGTEWGGRDRRGLPRFETRGNHVDSREWEEYRIPGGHLFDLAEQEEYRSQADC